jgi:hypothetical protein
MYYHHIRNNKQQDTSNKERIEQALFKHPKHLNKLNKLNNIIVNKKK